MSVKTFYIVGVVDDGSTPNPRQLVPAPNKALTLAQGSDAVVVLTVRTPASVPISTAAPASLVLTVTSAPGVVTASFTGVAQSDGSARFTLAEAVTRNIQPGRYVYDVWLTDTSGLRTQVVPPSLFQSLATGATPP